MRTRRRRRLDRVLLVGGAAVAAGVSVAGGALGSEEEIRSYWTVATVQGDDGTAVVDEVIDYSFGLALDKHGIFRDVPGLPRTGPVEVHSPTAPDDVLVQTAPNGDTRLRIGHPERTVTGDHRYLITYRLPGVAPGGRLAWNGVGPQWDVAIGRAEVHVRAPWEFEDPVCQRGSAGSTDPCEVEQPEPGHLVAVVEDLDAREGVTIRAAAGRSLPAVPAVEAPGDELPADDGAGLAVPAAVAAGAALLASAPVSALVRRAGRERVAGPHAASAAFAGATAPDAGAIEQRMDAVELAELATTEFAPPEGITAAHGGIVHDEQVLDRHRVAWLIEMAIAGAIELEETGRKKVTLRRTGAEPPPDTATILNTIFKNRDAVDLGSYDRRFASAWKKLQSRLETWQRRSGYWDPAGQQQMHAARGLGVLLVLLGVAGVGFGGAFAHRSGAPWMVLGALGAALFGSGVALLLRSWELKVRTPEGSGIWLRIESFRRFLHDSEAHHAEEAAARGRLREYTAWAVALGEIDRWSRAVEQATAITDTAGLGYVHMAPILFASSSSTARAPSSSGGGGGFGGGGVGGGAGGGGGGSW